MTTFVFLSAWTHLPGPGVPEQPWATQRVLRGQKAQRALLGPAAVLCWPWGGICTLQPSALGPSLLICTCPGVQVWANVPKFLLIVCLLGGGTFVIYSAPRPTTVRALYMSRAPRWSAPLGASPPHLHAQTPPQPLRDSLGLPRAPAPLLLTGMCLFSEPPW